MFVNHPYHIFYQGNIYAPYESDARYRSRLESIFKEIDSFLKINSSSILLTVTREMDYNEIENFLRKNLISKVYFFVDDVFQIKFNDQVSIDCSILESNPSDFSIVEFDLLQQLVEKLEIDNEVYYCEANLREIKNLYPKLNFKFFDITNAVTIYGVFQNVNNFDFKEEFKHKLCCFNYRPDINRSIIISLLYNQPNIFLTGGQVISYDEVNGNTRVPLSKFSNEMQLRIKNGLRDIEENKIDLSWDLSVDRTKLPLKEHWNVINVINDSFCNVVTETKYDTYTHNFSEKTLKPILVKRPFIVVSTPGTLYLLRQLGFKTFNRWWDESYDNIENHVERLEAIDKIIQYILSKSVDELKLILDDMQQVLSHNFENAKQLNQRMLAIT